MAITPAARRTFGAGLTLGLFALAGPTLAQDANTILTKSSAAYKSIKTYQADMIMDIDSPQGKMIMNMAMKRDGTKMAMKMSGTPPKGAPAGAMNMNMVTDGKTMFMYMGMMNSYMKMPLNDQMKQQLSANAPDGFVKMAKNGKVTRGKDANVDGAPTFVLEYTGKPIQGSGGAQMDKATFYIDKASYRLKRLKGNMKAGTAGPMGGGAMTMTIKNEKLNGAIPASAFVFTPPAGAKEMNPGMMGGAGAAPRR